MPPLSYRPNEFDDWGTIRDATGDVYAFIRRPLSEDEAAAHRSAKTDPFEALARKLIDVDTREAELVLVVGILLDVLEEYDHNLEGQEQVLFAEIVSKMRARLDKPAA